MFEGNPDLYIVVKTPDGSQILYTIALFICLGHQLAAQGHVGLIERAVKQVLGLLTSCTYECGTGKMPRPQEKSIILFVEQASSLPLSVQPPAFFTKTF